MNLRTCLCISRESAKPPFQQLAECVQEQIDRGDIPIGRQLPTVREFCEWTGLSRVTVSRAMVLLQQNGYVVSRRGSGSFVIAKRRRAENHASIGFIVRPHRDPIRDPFYYEILLGVIDEAKETGYSLAFSKSEAEIETQLHHGTQGELFHVSGLILAGQMPRALIEPILRLSIPTVLVDALPKGYRVDAVTVDQTRIGTLLAEHLLSLGHRRVLYLDGLPDIAGYEIRYQAFQETFLHESTCRIERMNGAQQASLGREFIQRAIQQGLAFTAVVGCNDMVAIGAMNALQDAGIRVPQDVSVCGTGGIAFAEESRPALTTVMVPKKEMGRRAVRLLRNRIAHPGGLRETLILEVEFIQRNSTGPAPDINHNPEFASQSIGLVHNPNEAPILL